MLSVIDRKREAVRLCWCRQTIVRAIHLPAWHARGGYRTHSHLLDRLVYSPMLVCRARREARPRLVDWALAVLRLYHQYQRGF
jgi:hypothetical protein